MMTCKPLVIALAAISSATGVAPINAMVED
jgi:hypothetical protein